MNRTLQPIVTSEWLIAELAAGADLTVLDLRWAEEYAAGHVPGAISVPFGIQSVWSESGGDYLLELPPDQDLFRLIGDCGLTADSRIVLVGRTDPPPAPQYALADPARAAATLIYAGVPDVAVLSGGYPAWERAGGATTTEVPEVGPCPYVGSPDKQSWVSTEYVQQRIGRAVLIDGRDPDQYFGVSIDPFADMRGHIPTARCLPAEWIWEADGTFRSAESISGMVSGVVGEGRDQEVIAYCGVGGYASTWWFLLTQLLGYVNVKIYDGSMEAWVAEGHPLVKYSWTS